MESGIGVGQQTGSDIFHAVGDFCISNDVFS